MLNYMKTKRTKLQNSYVSQVLDDMDTKTLVQFASDLLHDHLNKESDEELTDTVKKLYPELLDDT